MKHITLFALLLLGVFFTQAKTSSDSATISLYPNPNQGVFYLRIESPVVQKIGVSILNLMGQTISADSQQLIVGANQFTYYLTGQKNGIYFVNIAGKNWSQTQKIIVDAPGPTRSDSLDIVHYDLSLTIRNLASKSIGGTAIIKVTSKVNGLSQFTLDLLKLNTSGVQVNGVAQIFSQTDSTLFIQLSSPKQANDTFEIAISYGGQPVTDASWGGFYFSGDYAYNMGVAFTSNPHNFGRCWFPCIDNFTDRATYSFHITTDSLFKAVCNGLILPETIHPDGSTTWNWELNQSIPTYLASVAVGKYEFLKYEFVGQTRTYPIWIAVVAADTTKAKASFAKLNNALACFEQKYGAYPFDRVGYVGVPFNAGAMEHATNIAYPNYAINGGTNYETLFAHELSHMWWGDLATCRTPEEMWLNEGWASFNEALFLECVYGKAAYTNDIQTKSITVLHNAPSDDGAWLAVSGVPHNATYGTHVYKKGALMVHTLRALMGDSAFFAATRAYMQTYQFKDVSTEDLKKAFQPFTTKDLTSFFQKWIYSAGHSDIVMSGYTQIGNTYHFDFRELNRINNLTTHSLPFTFKLYLSNGSAIHRSFTLTNGQTSWDTTLTQGISMTDYGINEDQRVQLAHITQKQPADTTGNIAFANTLFSANVQTAGVAGDSLVITHHWVGPTDVNLRTKGIRISSERYWTVQGKQQEGFKAWGFFNYNGIPSRFLDTELIPQTEDSLVLLYRQNPNIDWAIHTDNTFQPGTNKADKTGRFWVNDLKRGEYAFGRRDANVVGLKEVLTPAKVGFNIIPNPTDSENHITLMFAQNTYVKDISIINLQGQLIKQINIDKKQDQSVVDIHDLPQGQYIITAMANGTAVSQKFIKSK